MSKETQSMLLGLVGISCFGLTLPITRYIGEYLDPIFIGLGRAALAGLVAAGILFFFRVSFPSKAQLKKLSVVVLGVVVGFPVFSSIAMQYVPASHGGVVVGLLPLVTAVVGVLLSKERPSKGFWLTGIVGSSLVVIFALWEGAGELHVGDFSLMLAIVLAAFGYAVGAQLAKEMGGWQVICWSLVLAFPFIVIPAGIQAPQNIANLPPLVWLGFLYLALFSQLFGFFFWYKALALGGVARVSQIQLNQPFITLVAAAFLLGEALTLRTWIFAFLVVGLVALSKKMPIHRVVQPQKQEVLVS